MNKQELITKTERVDDIPLLLAQMQRIQLPDLINEHFPTHGNWKGASMGEVFTGWLCYILSQGDHRLNHVESWVKSLPVTLNEGLGTEVRPLDFSDDRLAKVLDSLAEEPKWEHCERSLNACILRVYDLKAERIRLDTTTVKSYVGVTEAGLFQFGHSKDHRSDLPQLKISQSALDPLGMPVTTTAVSGNLADDPLYIPEIRRVQDSMGTQGLFYIGDCKMGSLETRAYVAHTGDYYLCPLSAVQIPPGEMESLLEPVWKKEQKLTPVLRSQTPEEISCKEKQESIASGFVHEVTLHSEVEGKSIEWQEQRLVVHSLNYAQSQQKALDVRLEKAQARLAELNRRGRGRKALTAGEYSVAVEKILKKYRTGDILKVDYQTEIFQIQKRAYKDRPARTVKKVEITVQSKIELPAYQNTVRSLGWRIYACNDLQLSLGEAVRAYREEYLIERGFGRYKGKVLGLTPLYLSSENRIKGLVRLLSIGLRILCLLDFSVRRSLYDRKEKLAGIYRGNPRRATARPTAEMLLKAFEWITLTEVHINGARHRCLSTLSAVQVRILELLRFPVTIYLALSG